MNNTQIRLIGTTLVAIRESVSALEGLLNGVVGADGLTQTVEFHPPHPGHRSGFLAYGTLTVGIPAQERRS